MRIVVLAGGIGGARFLLGVRAWARRHGAEVTAVVNVGDDVTLHGLRICPDLDSVMYTLGGGADPERGWGRAGETWTVKEELAAYGAEPTWFGLGDKDVATHLVRTRMLGRRLPAVGGDRGAVRPLAARRTAAAGHRRPGGDPRGGAGAGRQRAGDPLPGVVDPPPRRRCRPERFVFVGADPAKPRRGVLDALAAADVVLLAPSNPVVQIAPILAVAALRDGAGRRAAPRSSASPRSSAGSPVRGMADRCLAAIDVPCSAAGVGRLYGARAGRRGARRAGWSTPPTPDATCPGSRCGAAPLWMTDEAATEAMVRGAELARGRSRLTGCEILPVTRDRRCRARATTWPP